MPVKAKRTKKSSRRKTMKTTKRKTAIRATKKKTKSKKKLTRAKKSAKRKVTKVKTKPKAVVSKKVKHKVKNVKPKTKVKKSHVKVKSVKTVAPRHKKERVTELRPVKFFEFEGIEPYRPKAKELYMSPAMLEHFRKILMAWHDRLMAEADRTVSQMRGGAEVPADLNDRATQEEEFSLELRARDRDRKLVRKIEESLHSISDGSYGYCEACGEEIGLRRLEARPTASLCIDCKELDEIKEKQVGS